MKQPKLAEFASLLSDPSRATILSALLDGRAHPAGDLAAMAGITPQTASFHLAKLREAGVVVSERYGRHHYFQLHNAEAAEWLESFLQATPLPEIRSLKQSIQMKELRSARTCYDHLAGELGVRFTQALLEQNWLVEQRADFELSPEGASVFSQWGVQLAPLRGLRRAFARKCLDWSERRPHLAGALGSAVTSRMLELRWVERVPQSRALTVTEQGAVGLRETFHVTMSEHTEVIVSQ